MFSPLEPAVSITGRGLFKSENSGCQSLGYCISAPVALSSRWICTGSWLIVLWHIWVEKPSALSKRREWLRKKLFKRWKIKSYLAEADEINLNFRRVWILNLKKDEILSKYWTKKSSGSLTNDSSSGRNREAPTSKSKLSLKIRRRFGEDPA